MLLGGVYVPSGDAALDEIVGAVTSEDTDRVASLIATTEVSCDASRVHPPCIAGQDVGRAVPAFQLSDTGRGPRWVRVGADEAMDVATKSDLASYVIGHRPRLAGVVRLRESLDGSVEADTLVFIAQRDVFDQVFDHSIDGVKLFVRDGRIVGLTFASYPGDFALWYKNAAREGTVLIAPPR